MNEFACVLIGTPIKAFESGFWLASFKLVDKYSNIFSEYSGLKFFLMYKI